MVASIYFKQELLLPTLLLFHHTLQVTQVFPQIFAPWSEAECGV